MNKKIILGAVLAALVGTTGVAAAQNRGPDGRDNGRSEHRDNRNGDKHDNKKNDRHDDRHDAGPDRRNDRIDYRHDNRDPNRGAGPRHDLRKGHRLPPEYRSKQYVVDNWRSHRLSAPPRGYHWVQTGADYVLVGIATGVIATLFLAN
jgi:Ni/Co efflux regulator RcnB